MRLVVFNNYSYIDKDYMPLNLNRYLTNRSVPKVQKPGNPA